MGRKSIQVPEEFYAHVKSRKRDDETLGETLIRLVAKPHPNGDVEPIADKTAEAMLEAIEARGTNSEKGRISTTESLVSEDDS